MQQVAGVNRLRVCNGFTVSFVNAFLNICTFTEFFNCAVSASQDEISPFAINDENCDIGGMFKVMSVFSYAMVEVYDGFDHSK
jgi:hypothetical protein